jgi:hypothetical protein
MKIYQMKSHWYYVFWLIMATAVVGGQVYVGSGYRTLSKELRAYTQAVYDQQMGWGPCQKAIEEAANSRKPNKTFQFE